MRILFTGASSFTGHWFVHALAAVGHEVMATFTAPDNSTYTGLRRQRIEALPPNVGRCWSTPFGSEAMASLVESGPCDLFCHHGAVVGTAYKAGTFDYEAALHANTFNVESMLAALKRSGCRRVMLTGSYFEAEEGQGSDVEAVSSYGLSKTLTWQVFRYHCHKHGMALGKFVIANPFGSMEEARLSSYLAKCWLTGTEPVLKTPDYVRDYIPVDLLAASYRQSVESLATLDSGLSRFNPSLWVETNLAFAHRMASQLSPHLGCACTVRGERQTEFTEPLARQNTESLLAAGLPWDEAAFWKGLAHYYRQQFPVT